MPKNKTMTDQVESETPAVEKDRRAKVEAIKEAVRTGAYRVDGRSVANSLLRDLLEQEWETKRRHRS